MLFWVLIALALACSAAVHTSRYKTWKAITAVDGDTFLAIDQNNKRVKARLFAIDTPERGQPLYAEAKNELARQIVGRGLIKVLVRGKDRYGRVLVTVYRDGIDVNQHLVSSGLAFPDGRIRKSLGFYRHRIGGTGVWARRVRPKHALLRRSKLVWHYARWRNRWQRRRR